MSGWPRSVGYGPLTWMLSNATSIAWIDQPRRKERRRGRGPNRELTKEGGNENQTDQRIRGRPGKGPAVLYGGAGLCKEIRFQSGSISLADRSLGRGTKRH